MIGIVIDMDVRWWKSTKDSSTNVSAVGNILNAIQFYLNAANSVLTTSSHNVCVIGAFSEKAVTLASGAVSAVVSSASVGIMRGKIIEELNRINETIVYESSVAQGISKALCIWKKAGNAVSSKRNSRIVVIDCSRESTDFVSQGVALSNCGWAAATNSDESVEIQIDVVSIASGTPSSSLLALCMKTGGIHIPFEKCQSMGALTQSMLFHLTLPDSLNKSLKVRPQTHKLHMGATCVCHNKSLEKGYVCSVCLAIYCNEMAGICSVCGSRIRREAKEELPLYAQTFSKLFSNDSLTIEGNR